jgi:hypothetical protein
MVSVAVQARWTVQVTVETEIVKDTLIQAPPAITVVLRNIQWIVQEFVEGQKYIRPVDIV